LDADIEAPSDASYISISPSITPTRSIEGNVFPMATSPTTPPAITRGTHVIEALSDLVDAITRGSRGDISLDAHMDLEELEEEEDLDADIEDMDDESL
jgi:hypothetical protein